MTTTMAQIICEHPHELRYFIDNLDKVKTVNVRFRSVYPSRITSLIKTFECLTIHTPLPQVLIQIIDSYGGEVYDILITRNIVGVQGLYRRDIHMHFNFDTDVFRSLCCIKFKYGGESEYGSILNTLINDDKILEYKMFQSEKRENPILLDQQQKLLKNYLKQSNIRLKACDSINEYCDNCDNDHSTHVGFDRNYAFNSILFFNNYSMNTRQYHNMIKHISPRNINLDNGNIWFTEDCKYIKKTNCYKHVLVSDFSSKITQYKIVDHAQFTNILKINKILYEFIDREMKEKSHYYFKIEPLLKIK